MKDSGLIISLELAGGAGDEGEYQEIRELAEKCPFAVTFAGKITQQELAKKMNQSDVFVLPSFYEGLPLVIIEALACGTYVICTDPVSYTHLDVYKRQVPDHAIYNEH